MAVVTVPYQMDVPKEGKEIVDSVAAIVEHFKAGKSLADAAVLLPGVMQAVDGYDKLGEEAGSKYADEMAGYLVHKVIGALRKEVAA